jgi:hypothetical protein
MDAIKEKLTALPVFLILSSRASKAIEPLTMTSFLSRLISKEEMPDNAFGF